MLFVRKSSARDFDVCQGVDCGNLQALVEVNAFRQDGVLFAHLLVERTVKHLDGGHFYWAAYMDKTNDVKISQLFYKKKQSLEILKI